MPTDLNAQPAQPEQTQLPEGYLDALVQNPIIQQVVAGDLMGVSAPPDLLGGETPAVISRLKAGVGQIGLDFVVAPKTDRFVVFNPQLIDKEEILQADSEGQLDNIVAPVERADSAETAQTAPPAPATAAAAPNPAAALFQPSTPASVPPQRLEATQLPPPSQQPAPAAGNVVNRLFKPVV